MRQTQVTDIAIIGAGPYGLSLAAHVAATGAQFRIFGRPMQTWREHMPAGMHLKSEGFASNLSDPAGALTLKRFCADRGLSYADIGSPVSLATFAAYGLAFQQQFVPDLVQRNVVSLSRGGDNFTLGIEGGENLVCRRVVVAVGITPFAHIPPELAVLPETLLTHSVAHGPLERFNGKTIAVIGAGASAVDTAVLAAKAGARVHLVCRDQAVDFHSPPSNKPRSIKARLRRPQTGLGPSWTSWFAVHMPLAYHALPRKMREYILGSHLGPAACWFTRDDFVAHVVFHGGVQIAGVTAEADQAILTIEHENETREELRVDHVIAATGYRTDLAQLGFLPPALQAEIATQGGSPVVSTNFKSSVPGLYFLGLTAAASFGPMLRFAYGSDFAARRLSRHLARDQQQVLG